MAETKSQRRRDLYRLLGDLPPRRRRISARKIAEERRDAFLIERLLLDLNGIEPVPAYFIRPADAPAPRPTIVYNHSHGGYYDVGKEELFQGQPYIRPYAEVLAGLGYNALAIDAWAFGERRGRTEGTIFKEMLWHGQVMWGMMVYDTLRAVDYLVSRDDVDASRLATLGISMGSTMAWWLAALDERIKVCVDLCCLTDFEALIETGETDHHGVFYFVPSLLKHFSTAEINALIAPRPHLALAGMYDRLTPARGLDRIDAHLRKAYKAEGAAGAWQLRRYPVGHMETAAMRADVLAFLKRWL